MVRRAIFMKRTECMSLHNILLGNDVAQLQVVTLRQKPHNANESNPFPERARVKTSLMPIIMKMLRD